MICSPIELDTDGAILLRQDGRASWASFHGSRMADASSRWSSSVVAQRVRTVTQHPVAAICRTMRMARRTAYYAARVRPAGFYRRLDDETVLQQIRAVTNSRATYGYRSVWVMVNR